MAHFWEHLPERMSEDDFVEWYGGAVGERRRAPALWGDGRYNQPTQPVVGVNWYEALAYAEWLSRVTGAGYRLPTEAEWEWAARRATRRFPWEGEWDASRCNWSGSRLNRPAPVSVFPHGSTPDGLHDLAGNVFEWTASLYRPYPYESGDGREDPLADGVRVLRGGSWYTGSSQVRCASRNRIPPWSGRSLRGFRLARTLS
jgi:formylglycine-generating enzyme required for sulfatase activity